MPFQFKLIHKGLLLVAITLFFEISFVLFLLILVQNANVEIDKQSESKKIIATCDTLLKSLYQAIAALLSYSTVHSQKFLIDYEKIVPQLLIEQQSLTELLDKHNSSASINIKSDVAQILKLLNEAKNLTKPDTQPFQFFDGQKLNGKIIAAVNTLTKHIQSAVLNEESKIGASPESIRKRIYAYILTGLVLNVLFAIALAFALTRGTARRLDVLMENVLRFGHNQTLLQRISGNDEISEIDSVFHQMVKMISEANRKTRAVIENSVDVICSLNDAGIFVSINKAVEHSWGYSQSELLGRYLVDIVERGDRQLVHDRLRGAANSSQTLSIECDVQTKQGQTLKILWSIQWSDVDKVFYCVAHDFTERKKYEKLLQDNARQISLILEHMPVGVLSLNSKGIIQTANSAIEELLLFESTELCGKEFQSLFADGRLIEEALNSSCDSDKTEEFNVLEPNQLRRLGQRQELSVLKKNGHIAPVKVSFGSFEGTDGRIILLNVADISDEKRVEQIRKEISAMVTHDLRSPLTSLRGFLELIELGKYGALNEQGQNRLTAAVRNVDYLVNLTNDLLDVEKLESGVIQLAKEQVMLRDLFEHSASVVLELAEKKQIQLVWQDSPAIALIDRARMTQALVNLISNAINFSPVNGIISVKAFSTADNVIISVSDEGPGIPDDEKKRIFERFHQIHTKSDVAKKGSGLGLTICKAIVELHGGRVEVNDNIGRGSVFSIYL